MPKFEAPATPPNEDAVTTLFRNLTELPTYKGTDPADPTIKIVDEINIKGTDIRVMHHTQSNGPFYLEFPQLDQEIGLGTGWFDAKQKVQRAIDVANRPENDSPDKIFDAILLELEGE